MPPSTAIEVVTSYGVPNPATVIRDYAAAGIVRTTAKVLEWIDGTGIHTTGHNEEVSTDLWKRIVREEADVGIWLAGTARMERGMPTDDQPHVILTGIRFKTLDIHKVGWSHRGYIMPKASKEAIGGEPGDAVKTQEPVASTSPRTRRSPDASAIPPGAILCTIKQAGDALGIGRTKVNDLMNNGRLVRSKIDGGVRITVASVMALATKAA